MPRCDSQHLWAEPRRCLDLAALGCFRKTHPTPADPLVPISRLEVHPQSRSFSPAQLPRTPSPLMPPLLALLPHLSSHGTVQALVPPLPPAWSPPIHLQPSWQPVCLPRSRSRSRGFPAPPPPAAFQSLQGDLSLTLRPLTCGPLCLRGPSWFAGPTLYRLPTKDTIIAAAVVIPVAGSEAVTHTEGTVEGRPGSRVLALTFILRPHTETPARLRCLGRGVRRMQAPSLLCP